MANTPLEYEFIYKCLNVRYGVNHSVSLSEMKYLLGL